MPPKIGKTWLDFGPLGRMGNGPSAEAEAAASMSLLPINRRNSSTTSDLRLLLRSQNSTMYPEVYMSLDYKMPRHDRER